MTGTDLDENISDDSWVTVQSIDEYNSYKKTVMQELKDELQGEELDRELNEESDEELNNIITICIRCDSQLTNEQNFCPNCGLEISLIKKYLSEDNKRVVDYKINTLAMEALHTVDKFHKSTDEEKFHMGILSAWKDTENKMINVVSSNIQSIGYDLETESLFVKFNNNFLYLYMEVPEKYCDEFLDVSSKGKYHNKVITNNFEYFNMTELLKNSSSRK